MKVTGKVIIKVNGREIEARGAQLTTGGHFVVPVSHSVNATDVVFNAPGIEVFIPIRAEYTAEQASAEIRRALEMLPLEARGTLRWDGAAWRDA